MAMKKMVMNKREDHQWHHELAKQSSHFGQGRHPSSCTWPQRI